MRFLVVCAGTAGHINPALAIAGELRRVMPEAEFLFVGAGREMERRLIPREGYELKNLRVTGLARGFSGEDIRHNLETLNNLVNANHDAKKVIEEFKPDCVIGTGGYICYPVIRAAAKKGIPTVLHESNAEPGLAIKLLSGMATRILVAYPGVEERYNKPKRVIYTGTPIKGDFVDITRAEAKRRIGIDPAEPVVASFWGSLGADDMNRKMAEFIALNEHSGAFRHIHATGGGETGMEKMRSRLSAYRVNELKTTDLRPYINDMGTVMMAADLIISRAGGSTLAEITNTGTAAILVPSPNVTANQQEKNALELEKQGAAIMLRESECTGESLYNEAVALLEDGERLQSLEKASLRLGKPRAREKIAEIILGLVNKNG